MARSIMIQGTMSNAGKSILTAGLCCIFMQNGYKIAPFKSQNMALNSYIASEGLEMGRAQVVQAEAANVPPSADMNPILLKPATDMGSQVIVHGISKGNMKAKDYFAIKRSLVPGIMASYERLSRACDTIVIEGAGSPAEINLKSDDIVNMGLAALVDAPVLLVRDIDRGDVFVQLYGTIALLEQGEHDRVKGLVINKFRGDKSILGPGVHMLEELCHIPVAGVVPYMDVDIEDEDSLSIRLDSSQDLDNGESGMIDLAVTRFPHTSNLMDFNVFSRIPGVSLRYMARVSELGTPDMVFLPGTKNTIQDLLWMRQNGLETAVLKLADRQMPVWGICGGYQVMGERLKDSQGVESDGNREIAGMGLLLLGTESYEEKVKAQAESSFGEPDGMLQPLSGACIEGYEIHMGRTAIDRENGAMDTARLVSWRREPEVYRPMVYLMEKQTGEAGGGDRKKVKTDGWNRGNVYGACVRGVFDVPGIGEGTINCLAKKKGLSVEAVTNGDYKSYRGQQYDKLADILRASLDMDAVYGIIGLPPRSRN